MAKFEILNFLYNLQHAILDSGIMLWLACHMLYVDLDRHRD
jgi:hypothetical protein